MDGEGSSEGEPLDEGGPEWDNVEQERDHWKALALSYGAKLKAIEHTMASSWAVEHATDGSWVVRQDGQLADRVPLPSLDEVADQINKP